ncbi:hypothetical protein JCM39194_03740 [Desulfotomaculum varum]
MKTAWKRIAGWTVGAFMFAMTLVVTGTGSAEAYTYYNYTTYKAVNYTKYTSNYNYYQYTANRPASQTNNQSVSQPQQASTQVPTQTTSQPSTQPSQQTAAASLNISVADEQAMLNLINQERRAAGLQPLVYDAKLTELARLKAQDMITNNYFSHTSPTYGSPFDMMKNAGITYRYAGENLAGAPDVNTAHKNLMNSPSHKANILKPEYTKVGIGVVNGGPYGKMFVQMFNG